MWVLFVVLVISAWVLGSAIPAGAETMKCRVALTTTKVEGIAVSDEEGHYLGLSIAEGLVFFENGEIAKARGSGRSSAPPLDSICKLGTWTTLRLSTRKALGLLFS